MHIAVCGELGAGCTEVGYILSRKLSRGCISSADIVRRIMSNFGEDIKEFEEHVQSGEVDLDQMIDKEIDELLGEGDLLIEGRSALMLLNNDGVFKVLLVASHVKKAAHLATMRGILVDETKEALQSSDAERKHMVERLFKKDWLDPHNYDITVNTDLISYENAADLIIRAADQKSIS